ncbi:hypothetical protein OAO01_01550 [Oligoflexia bacterium]|nr:hypothetical protein [Oligoflexia bacterium]
MPTQENGKSTAVGYLDASISQEEDRVLDMVQDLRQLEGASGFEPQGLGEGASDTIDMIALKSELPSVIGQQAPQGARQLEQSKLVQVAGRVLGGSKEQVTALLKAVEDYNSTKSQGLQSETGRIALKKVHELERELEKTIIDAMMKSDLGPGVGRYPVVVKSVDLKLQAASPGQEPVLKISVQKLNKNRLILENDGYIGAEFKINSSTGDTELQRSVDKKLRLDLAVESEPFRTVLKQHLQEILSDNPKTFRPDQKHMKAFEQDTLKALEIDIGVSPRIRMKIRKGTVEIEWQSGGGLATGHLYEDRGTFEREPSLMKTKVSIDFSSKEGVVELSPANKTRVDHTER